ncbi:hypothetical protein D8I24_4344 [Cupriavidus necator H850]|nr:hypothetical protein D8I24_4344 [Cupriavidus necator H850]
MWKNPVSALPDATSAAGRTDTPVCLFFEQPMVPPYKSKT